MKRRRSSPRRVPEFSVWRSGYGTAALREHVDRGAIVNVFADRERSYQIVRNGNRYLVRDDETMPLATVDTLDEALAAGDTHLDGSVNDPDDHLPGAA